MQATSRQIVPQQPAPTGDDWVDSVVGVAQTCKKLFTQHTCRLCQVYVDEQVEFERRQEEASGHVPRKSWMQTQPTLEVELYRQFLFDEDSVVEHVSEREMSEAAALPSAAEEEQQTVTTQRTQ